MVALEVAVATNDRNDQKGTNDREPKDNVGRNLYVLTIIAALAALLITFMLPAHAAPARTAQRPLENEILQIAQTAQGTTQPAQTGVREVTWVELQEEVASNRGAILIEFYRAGYPDDPNIADDCDNCANQLPAFEKTAQHYAGKITFLRFNVDQHPQLMNVGLVVFPTHVFMVHDSKDLWVRSIRGFLTEKEFQETVEELFKIKP